LKPFKGQLPHPPYIPDWLQWQDVAITKVPEKSLAQRLVKRQNQAATQLFVQWQGATNAQALWEFVDSFTALYPLFKP